MGLIGPSGSGKSMTLQCIAGLVQPDEGRIVLGDRVLFDSERGINLPCHERRIGYLFQNYALFPKMTVEENIGFGLYKLPPSKRVEIVRQMIYQVHLDGFAKYYPSQLSGGQQQRVALARALAVNPQALLLDEPFSALDEHLRMQMTRDLSALLESYQGATILVTHNSEEAYRICHELVMLHEGQIEMKGPKTKFFSSPNSLIAAQMSGFRNVSSAFLTETGEIHARNWGISLTSQPAVQSDIKYVCIHAHHIRLAKEADRINVFQVWMAFVSETPFKMTLFLSFREHSTESMGDQLEWEVSPDLWQTLSSMPLPWKITLDPEHLIVLVR